MNIWKDLEKRGRHGDTMMKKIDGELAHVNAVEYELSPETIKESGSGTINPTTGKKEYFIPLLVGAAAAVGSGLKALQIGKENEAKREAQKQAGLIKEAGLELAGEQQDLTVEAGEQVSSAGQIAAGLEATSATSNIYSQKSKGTTTMATSGTSINIQEKAIGDVTAKAQSQVQNLVATRNLKTKQAGITFEGREADIEKEFQSMLTANQETTGWDAVGQVIGQGVSFGSAAMGVPGKTPVA